MPIAAALDVAKPTNKFQFLHKKGIACHPDPAPRQECNACTPSGAHALRTPPARGVEGSSAPAPTNISVWLLARCHSASRRRERRSLSYKTGPSGFCAISTSPRPGLALYSIVGATRGRPLVSLMAMAPRNGTGRSKAAVHDLVRPRRRAGHSTVPAVLDQLYAGRKQYLIAGSRRCSTKARWQRSQPAPTRSKAR